MFTLSEFMDVVGDLRFVAAFRYANLTHFFGVDVNSGPVLFTLWLSIIVTAHVYVIVAPAVITWWRAHQGEWDAPAITTDVSLVEQVRQASDNHGD